MSGLIHFIAVFYSTTLVRFLGLISYPDPSLILSLVEVQSLIQSDSPLVAILKFAVSSWCEAWDRGIFGAARISSSFNSANDNIFREFTDCPRPPNISGLKGPVSRKSGNFWGAESCFVFSAFTFKIRVSSIILKIIKWNYQLTKQNWLVYKLGTVLLFNMFGFYNLPSGPKSFRAFRKTGPRLCTSWPLNSKWQPQKTNSKHR